MNNLQYFIKRNPVSLKKLQNQVIVITGASSSIGLVTPKMAAARGAKVVAAAGNEEALKQLVDELRKNGCEAAWVRADVGREEDVNNIAEIAVKELEDLILGQIMLASQFTATP